MRDFGVLSPCLGVCLDFALLPAIPHPPSPVGPILLSPLHASTADGIVAELGPEQKHRSQNVFFTYKLRDSLFTVTKVSFET